MSSPPPPPPPRAGPSSQLLLSPGAAPMPVSLRASDPETGPALVQAHAGWRMPRSGHMESYRCRAARHWSGTRPAHVPRPARLTPDCS